MATFSTSVRPVRAEPHVSPSEPGDVGVSIIIVTWNSANFVGECLSSLYTQTQDCSFEVIVVDNGSNDQTVEIIEGEFPKTLIISAGENLGFPRASNLAIRKSVGRHIFLVNPDGSLRTDVASELARFLDTHPNAGAAGPRILKRDGGVDLFAAREFPSVSGTLFTLLGLRKLFPRSCWIEGRTLPDQERRSVSSVPCLTGAAIMIPRCVMAQVGMLDETLPLYFEDLDICARIRAAGKDLFYVPSAELTHIGGQSAEESPFRTTLWAMEKGQAPWMWFRTYRGQSPAIAFSLATFLGSAARCCFLAVVMPLARLGGQDLSRWASSNIRKSWALLRWSVSSKRKFASRARAMFAPDSPLEPPEPLRLPAVSQRMAIDKPESVTPIE